MRVRNAEPKDYERLKQIHEASCIPYDFPNLDDPEFIAKLVVVDENDTPVVAGLGRKTVEIYGLVDSEWETPAWRFEALAMLHEAMRHEVGKQGYHDVHAWIHPQLVKTFARKLKHLFGWQADPWPSFCRKTGY